MYLQLLFSDIVSFLRGDIKAKLFILFLISVEKLKNESLNTDIVETNIFKIYN